MNRVGKLINSMSLLLCAGIMLWDYISPWSAIDSGVRVIYPFIFGTLAIVGLTGLFYVFHPVDKKLGKQIVSQLNGALVQPVYSKIIKGSVNDEVSIVAKTTDGRSVAVMLDRPTEIRYTVSDPGLTKKYEEKQVSSLLKEGYTVIRIRYIGTPRLEISHPNLLVCNDFPPPKSATQTDYKPIIEFLSKSD